MLLQLTALYLLLTFPAIIEANTDGVMPRSASAGVNGVRPAVTYTGGGGPGVVTSGGGGVLRNVAPRGRRARPQRQQHQLLLQNPQQRHLQYNPQQQLLHDPQQQQLQLHYHQQVQHSPQLRQLHYPQQEQQQIADPMKRSTAAGAPAWSHIGDTGTSSWGNNYPLCNGKNQSPINIAQSAIIQKPANPLVFTGYNVLLKPTSYTLQNDGHTYQLNVVDGGISISGGDLPPSSSNGFKLAQFHLHWGSDNTKGCEHTVDGVYYPLEIHLVHYNTKYADLSAAVNQKDGLAVLGIFAQIGTVDHPTFQLLTTSTVLPKYLGDITSAGLTSFKLDSLLPDKLDDFIRYSGSLTTPPCYESVTWTVFSRSITVSQKQLDALRSMSMNTSKDKVQAPLVNNYRPTMPIGDRSVFRY